MTYKFFHSFAVLFLGSAIVLTACAPSATGPIPTTSAVAPGVIPDFIPTVTTVPATVTPAPTEARNPADALIVAFVKNGDVHLWEEAAGQSRIVAKSGDVNIVTMSDDGQVIAFTRRAWVGSELEGYEQFTLWAANSDGSNPREVIPAEFLRQRLDLTERDSTNFYQLGWIPETHRAIFSITKYIAQAEGMSHAIPHGAYVVDIDSGSVTVLAEATENLRLAPSPDGMQLALLSPVSLSFINADGSSRRQDVLTYPEAGLTGPLFPTGVWTADSSAFVLTGSFEMDPRTMINFTFWRVPVDGTAPVALASVLESDPNSVTYSPDGGYASYVQATDGQPPEVAGWSVKPFEVQAGPLAIPYFGKEAFMANLHWSPAGQAYAIRDHELSPLCPDATQDTQVCGEPVPLGINSSIITSLQWVDSDRFLVAGIEPNMLVLGKLDGTFLPVATWEDYEPVSWSAVIPH
jgi:hypothetical protein